MSPLKARLGQPLAHEASIAGDIIDGVGLTDMLPEILMQDANGQRFETVNIDPQGDLVRQLTLLARPEPVGGGEPLIIENGRRLRELGLVQLNRALASTTSGLRPLIDDLIAETRRRKSPLEERGQRLKQSYDKLQERLHRWQRYEGQRNSSLSGNLWRWIVGGDERLSLPQVVTVWNEREYQALQRSAINEAIQLAIWLLDTLIDLGGRLDELIAHARGLQAEIALRKEQLHNESAPYAPWTLRLDSSMIARVLADQVNVDALVADVLRFSTEGEGESVRLASQIERAARSEAERLLANKGIVELIELEARAAGATSDTDSFVLVGQELLERSGRPSWKLARAARPRFETLQLTPQGEPLYSLDGLATASYGAGDRIGFLRVQLGVAKDELALVQDGDEVFQTTLQQRNLFVLEEMVEAWERSQAHDAQQWIVNGQAPPQDSTQSISQ